MLLERWPFHAHPKGVGGHIVTILTPIHLFQYKLLWITAHMVALIILVMLTVRLSQQKT